MILLKKRCDMWIVRLVLNALAVLLVANMLPGITVHSFPVALLVAVVYGLVNAIIRPLLILLTLPITILTLGLFTLVINAAMLLLTAKVVPGFSVSGFWPAFWGALILWAISWLTASALRESTRVEHL